MRVTAGNNDSKNKKLKNDLCAFSRVKPKSYNQIYDWSLRVLTLISLYVGVGIPAHRR
jgi:hypothetical protein